MKERIVTNIRKADMTCTANGQRTPLPPVNLADYLGKLVPEPSVSLIQPTAPPPQIAIAPTPDQNPPPPTS